MRTIGGAMLDPLTQFAQETFNNLGEVIGIAVIACK
jgi:hypothetical protein